MCSPRLCWGKEGGRGGCLYGILAHLCSNNTFHHAQFVSTGRMSPPPPTLLSDKPYDWVISAVISDSLCLLGGIACLSPDGRGDSIHRYTQLFHPLFHFHGLPALDKTTHNLPLLLPKPCAHTKHTHTQTHSNTTDTVWVMGKVTGLLPSD